MELIGVHSTYYASCGPQIAASNLCVHYYCSGLIVHSICKQDCMRERERDTIIEMASNYRIIINTGTKLDGQRLTM